MRFVSLIFFVAFSAWAEFSAPLGVPVPPFGITNTHWMYTNASFTWDYGAGLVPYRTTTNGPYTHYIDKNHPSATDTANTFGTPTVPRKTFVANAVPGTVVELHNGPYIFNNLAAKMQFIGRGTSNAPIFFRGVSTNDRPQLGATLSIMGSFLVIENIDTYKNITCQLDLDPPGIGTNNTHDVAIRNNHQHGLGNETGSGAALGGFGHWTFNSSYPNYASNIVIWNNSIHGYGPISLTEEHDRGGIAVNGYNAFNIWIMDNDLYESGADSVRIGSNSDLVNPPTSRFAYISRNNMHDNGENALDIKMWNNAVISENLMHGFHPSSSDSGAAIVSHYQPTNIWILANTIYEATRGVSTSGTDTLYIMGNLFRNMTNEGVQFFGGNDEIHIIQNTFANCAQGIENIGGTIPIAPIINNIFYPMTGGGTAIDYDLSGFANTRMDHNLFYEDGGPLNIIWAGTTYTSLVTLSNNTTAGDFCMNVDPIYLNAATNNFNVNTNSSPAYGTGTNINFYTDLFFQRFGVSIDSYFKPNGTNMIGAYLTVVPDQPAAPEPVVGTRRPRGGRRFNIR